MARVVQQLESFLDRGDVEEAVLKAPHLQALESIQQGLGDRYPFGYFG
jgi:hypothetical protein